MSLAPCLRVMPKPLLFRLFELGARAVKEPVKEASETLIESAKDNAKAVGRSALDYTIFVLIGIVGYVFVFLGLALVLQSALGLAPALMLIGGIHVVVGVAGVMVLRNRKKEPEAQDPATLSSDAFAPIGEINAASDRA
jgi:Flp pilus assembly protein TadB